MQAAGDRRRRLRELAVVFLRLGVTGFGGPAAHIALMEDEVVRRRGWLTRKEFVDLLGAAQLIPGPNSTELAIHLGNRRAGALGLFVAGACFIAPAALITAVVAWLYVRFGSTPAADAVLYGMKPAILGIVVTAMARLVGAVFRGVSTTVLGIAAAGASLWGVDEVAILLAGGLVGLGAARMGQAPERASILLLGLPSAVATGASTTAMGPGLGALGLFFLKVGSVLYGSGYVLLAFLRGELVADRHWVTERQLLDAVAIGQLTPGPVSSTATFIGYLLRGPEGALVATVAIFLPSFFFVALTSPWVPRMRASPTFGGFLDGVNAASLGLMAAVVVHLARGALAGWPAWVIAVGALLATLLGRANASWVVLAGAALGWAAQALRLPG